jgi:hypothetical protein
LCLSCVCLVSVLCLSCVCLVSVLCLSCVFRVAVSVLEMRARDKGRDGARVGMGAKI